MSNLVTYISGLLPRFSRSRIIEDLRINRTELETVSIPSYSESVKTMGTWDFKSEEAINLIKVFERNVKTPKSENIISSIHKGLIKLKDVLDVTEDRVERIMEETIISDGITCLKANLVRTVEISAFVSRYSVKFLNYLYVVETAALKADPRYIRDNYSPAEIMAIEKSFTDFAIAFGVVTKTKQEFTKMMDDIPDIIISKGSADLVSNAMDNDKIDPLKLSGFNPSSTTFNPIYHIGIMVAEWQANRYKESKETKKILELRLLNLQLLKEKAPNAKLEDEIAYIQNRIQGLDHKIQKMEQDIK